VCTRVDGACELAQRGDDPGPRPHDPGIGDQLSDRHTEARDGCRVS
jgi:hypothetical protein